MSVPRPSVRAAVADREAPFSVLDLDAALANTADLVRRASGTPVRLATKSVRIRPLISRLLECEGIEGLLAYHLGEALWLVDEQVSDDILVAYPTADDAAVAELAADAGARAAIAIMVDSAEQLPALARHASDEAPLRVCLDVDASWKPVPGVHIGTLRSPTHSPRQAADLARAVDSTPGLRVIGVMMYEGHIAGLGDAGTGPRGVAIRLMQKLSRKELAKRRAKVVAAVEAAVGKLELVNGGGTGSLESTCAESAVTEAAAGSGFVGPTLFDNYRAFTPTPASWFLLPVVRRPKKDTVTVAGGGRIASGPAGTDRLPSPSFPSGLSYAPDEGPGEVQTPLTGDAARTLHIGDPVWFRHVKAGETAEHANVAIVVADGAIIDRWDTYRGKGLIYS